MSMAAKRMNTVHEERQNKLEKSSGKVRKILKTNNFLIAIGRKRRELNEERKTQSLGGHKTRI